MVRVALELDETGLLSSVKAEGHAGALRESGSVPCAAVSALLRTAARLIEARDGVEYEGGAPSAGFLSLRVGPVRRRQRRWLKGVGDYLIAGLRDVEREYPDECRVEIRTKE